MAGFSMVELLIAIVLTVIIMAAMVPVFMTALKRTSGDNLRNVAANLAQDRIEQVRLLSYNSITQTNLNSPPSPASSFGDGRFGPLYYITGSTKPYTIAYTVVARTQDKKVTVSVTWSPTDYVTTMQTIVKNSTAGVTSTTSSTPSPSPTITGLSISVTFKDWSDVNSQGVTVQRVQSSPVATVTPTPTLQIPNSGMQTLTWAGLTGGTAFTYTVVCHSYSSAEGKNISETSPPFHLLKNARLKFDTNPGGS